MSEDNDSESFLGELSSGMVSSWTKVLPIAPFKEQTAEMFGDIARRWRFNNLARIMGKVNDTADKRGLDSDQSRTLAMHVGLPWIEKAWNCDNDELQQKWAELLLALATSDADSYRSGTTFIRILEQLDPWDCKVLEYMARSGGVSRSFFRHVGYRGEIAGAIPAPEQDPTRTIVSIEKLVRCGCLETKDLEQSAQNFAIHMSDRLECYVSLTLTGLNFHIAVTGREPSWLSNEDNKIW